MMGIFSGYQFKENDLLMEPKTFQTRTHRRRRINKKWLKRYGYTTIMIPMESFVICKGIIYGHPTMVKAVMEKIDKSLENKIE